MKIQTNQQSQYINEIDSLRAIAVLGVLMFHLFPNIVTGGFIGVDVFFVLSGFVISRSYLFPLINKTIPIKQFWIKRIRRLMPAYLLVIICTTIAAYILLEPNLLKNYGKSLIGQSFYIQNILFWIEGSYFDGAITKPLLHTWSLGVEEQFYIFFILLIMISKGKTNRFIFFLSVIAIVSILMGYIISPVSPKTSFYLLPMRIWEFYIGILAYLIAGKWKIKQPSVIWNVLIYILFSIIIATFFFVKTSPFPGWQSLIACFSVFLMLCILIRLPKINNTILSNKAFQYIGKLSYSLYLWHWVLISLMVSGLNIDLNLLNSLIILIISFVLSILSYTFVENPIRRKQVLISTYKLFSTTIVLSLIVVLVGVFLIKSYGAAYRYEEPYKTWLITAQEKSPYRCGIMHRVINYGSEICKINSVENGNKKGLLIIGDSHADQLDEMIAELGEKYSIPIYMTVRNCKSNQYGFLAHCNNLVLDKIISEIQQHKIDTIISTSFWVEEGLKYESFNNSTQKLIGNGLKIVFSEVVPISENFNPLIKINKINEAQKTNDYLVLDYINYVNEQRQIFNKLKTEYPNNLFILRPQKYLCDDVKCEFSIKGKPKYFDNHHLSKYGVQLLLPMYDEYFLTNAK